MPGQCRRQFLVSHVEDLLGEAVELSVAIIVLTGVTRHPDSRDGRQRPR